MAKPPRKPTPTGDDPQPIRVRIANALAVLRATNPADERAVRQTFQLLTAAIESALTELDELEKQLDVATGPDRNAIQDIVALTRKLEKAELARAGLEQDLAMARADRHALEHLQQDQTARLKSLEQKEREFEALLLDDPDAFSKFMDKALDEQDRKGKPPHKR